MRVLNSYDLQFTDIIEKKVTELNKRNYQKELDKLIDNIKKEEKVPRLFLHSCCAPCSSYVLEYLSQYFEITVFFYNPNISSVEEYSKRVAEIRRMLAEMSFAHPVHIEEGTYDPQIFYEMAKGMEKSRRVVSGALNAIASVWKKQPDWHRKTIMITLLRHFPSAR